MFKENDFLPDTLKSLKVGYDNLLVKVPVVIKNSTLTNILLSELNFKVKVDQDSEHLDIGTALVIKYILNLFKVIYYGYNVILF